MAGVCKCVKFDVDLKKNLDWVDLIMFYLILDYCRAEVCTLLRAHLSNVYIYFENVVVIIRDVSWSIFVTLNIVFNKSFLPSVILWVSRHSSYFTINAKCHVSARIKRRFTYWRMWLLVSDYLDIIHIRSFHIYWYKHFCRFHFTWTFLRNRRPLSHSWILFHSWHHLKG